MARDTDKPTETGDGRRDGNVQSIFEDTERMPWQKAKKYGQADGKAAPPRQRKTRFLDRAARANRGDNPNNPYN